MNELSRLRGSERYGACGDEATADNRRTGKSSGRKQRCQGAESLRITGKVCWRLSFLWKSENGSFLSQEKGKNWFQEPFPAGRGTTATPFLLSLAKEETVLRAKEERRFWRAFLKLGSFSRCGNAVFVTSSLSPRLPAPRALWSCVSGIVRRSVRKTPQVVSVQRSNHA